MWHGPHHGAHASTSTGSGERSTSAAKVASVTARGAPPTGSGVLHRPQIGSSPFASLSRGTRLVAPQAGHGISSTSAVTDSAIAPSRERAARLHEPLAQVRAGMLEGAPHLRLRPAE